MIISISGSTGTGKTEIAKLLSMKLKFRLIPLNDLARKKKLYSGYDDKRKCDIVDIDKIEEELKEIRSKDIILESHYAHEIPSDITIILRTHPKELRKRLQKRYWIGKKIQENIDAEIMEVCKSEALELGRNVVEIDTTGKKPEEAVDEIIHRLNKNQSPEGSD